MKELLTLAAIFEALTGLVLVVYPPIVIRLLFDSSIAGAGVMICRLAGCSLIALGAACWPDRDLIRPYVGMLTYNVLAALYLAYVGVTSEVGILLWPAVVVHAALSLLLVQAWVKERRALVSIV